MWISVNPKVEREQIVHAAMALSGWYEQGWSADGEALHHLPLVSGLPPGEVADLFNNADALEIDIYSVSSIEIAKAE